MAYRKEFLVLRLGDDVKIGATVTILGVASSLEKAEELIWELSETHLGKIGIVEKKKIFRRSPAIETEEVEKANITEKSG